MSTNNVGLTGQLQLNSTLQSTYIFYYYINITSKVNHQCILLSLLCCTWDLQIREGQGAPDPLSPSAFLPLASPLIAHPASPLRLSRLAKRRGLRLFTLPEHQPQMHKKGALFR